jgi:hypothetical protein
MPGAGYPVITQPVNQNVPTPFPIVYQVRANGVVYSPSQYPQVYNVMPNAFAHNSNQLMPMPPQPNSQIVNSNRGFESYDTEVSPPNYSQVINNSNQMPPVTK